MVINTQFERNRELERIKQRLGEVYKRESDVYFKTWVAVSASYRLLSELQKGTLDPNSKTKIDTAFSEAEPNVFVLKDSHQDIFYAYWQDITELVALAENTANGPLSKLYGQRTRARWVNHSTKSAMSSEHSIWHRRRRQRPNGRFLRNRPDYSSGRIRCAEAPHATSKGQRRESEHQSSDRSHARSVSGWRYQ